MTKLTINSMTGYAHGQHEFQGNQLVIELRGVNSRFLDVQLRMPDELRHCEPKLRELISQHIVRGKVECRLTLNHQNTSSDTFEPNIQALHQLAKLQTQILTYFPQAHHLRASEILQWPGVLQNIQIDTDKLFAQVESLAGQILTEFQSSRNREGEKLKMILYQRITDMEQIVTQIVPMLPQLILQHQAKLTERMLDAIQTASTQSGAYLNHDELAERIRQEVTLYGIRIDIAEEIARLSAHLSETRAILEKGGVVGKRLDFMMQELNREANTLGSKAVTKELGDAAMALKLLIEQMREQVQNLE